MSFKDLSKLYDEVKKEVGEFCETEGRYDTEIVSAKFDPNNTWNIEGSKKKLPVPKLTITGKIKDGDHEGELITITYNFNGRKPEHIEISLFYFAKLVNTLGINDEGKGIEELIKEVMEVAPGKEVAMEVVKSGEYFNGRLC